MLKTLNTEASSKQNVKPWNTVLFILKSGRCHANRFCWTFDNRYQGCFHPQAAVSRSYQQPPTLGWSSIWASTEIGPKAGSSKLPRGCRRMLPRPRPSPRRLKGTPGPLRLPACPASLVNICSWFTYFDWNSRFYWWFFCVQIWKSSSSCISVNRLVLVRAGLSIPYILAAARQLRLRLRFLCVCVCVFKVCLQEPSHWHDLGKKPWNPGGG